MDVSENCGTPKSSILVGFSIINHPFWGAHPYFWKHPYIIPRDVACKFHQSGKKKTHYSSYDHDAMDIPSSHPRDPPFCAKKTQIAPDVQPQNSGNLQQIHVKKQGFILTQTAARWKTPKKTR